MTALFLVTAFLSAALLFVVQPMVGKMLLPLLGGAPSVWNTCMVFFQAVLLLGYLYAHLTTRWLDARRQALAHVILLALALSWLPIHLAEQTIAAVPYASSPLPWLLGALLRVVGLPLFVVSATAPLLQRWFAGTTHPRAHDPYFLYAASNAGSMVGLLSYPALVEPMLRVSEQTRWWAGGFGALVLLVAGCGFVVWRSRGSTDMPANIAELANVGTVTWRRRLRWIALAFVPSSLMLGVTTYLTTDVAPVPFLWVVPLALYLATFIVVFARRPVRPRPWMGRALCLPALVLMVAGIVDVNQPAWLILPLHLFMFWMAAMICHGQLAADRPTPRHLTEFYLCMSVGGVLGGAFNSLLAPLVFRALLEYPLMVLAACALQPRTVTAAAGRLQDIVWATGLGALTAVLILALQSFRGVPVPVATILMFGVPVLVTYRFVARPRRFTLCLGAVLLASVFYIPTRGRTLHAERNFFGVVRVTVDAAGRFRQFVHGRTLHGRQSLDPSRKDEPLLYYHRAGPAGQIFEAFHASATAPQVGVIGLGIGSLAAYAEPGDAWTFYEINPVVERIATDTRYFTLLAHSRAGNIEIKLGDARLRLREAADQQFGLLVLDAFSSDSIPVHLLTREALELYLAKVAEDGLLAFHVSNRRVDLKPVLANLADDAHLVAWSRDDLSLSDADVAGGRETSQWVMMARREIDLAVLTRDARWHRLSQGERRDAVWTDDFSNVFRALRWD